MTLEGNGAQRLIKLFGGGSTQPLTFTLATIVKPSPITVRIDGDTEDTPSVGIIVAEHLTDHKRTMHIVGGAYQEYEIQSNLDVGDRVIAVIANDGQLVYVLDKAVI